MLAGRALAVVVAADDGVLPRRLREPVARSPSSTWRERELGRARGCCCGTAGTRAPAGRISSVEMLSPTLISDRSPRRRSGSGSKSGQRRRCSAPLTSSMLARLVLGQRRLEHRRVARWTVAGRSSSRVGDAELAGQVARVGDDAGQRRRGGRLRGAQPDRVLVGAGPAGEVARHGAQAVAPGGRRLAHADAAHAPGLVDSGAGRDQVERRRPCASGPARICREVGLTSNDTRACVCRPRTMAGSDREVAQARVGRRADHHLVDSAAGHLADRHDVARRDWRWRSAARARPGRSSRHVVGGVRRRRPAR